MNTGPDVVLINPGDRRAVYQDLGKDYSGIEPPVWVAILAAWLRNQGFDATIIDANAENITPEETADRVGELSPLVAAVIVYGSQPSASTQNMPIAGRICHAVKERTEAKVAVGGLHPTALPRRTMQEENVDFVIEGEGQQTLAELLRAVRSGSGDLAGVPGLWYRDGAELRHNPRAATATDMDALVPFAAWDLLPMARYRAHNWHCLGHLDGRGHYGVLYTSLGCPYGCVFCCINALFGKRGIRHRNPELVVREIDLMVEKYGLRNLKIADELFVFDESHYMAIVEALVERDYGLNIWTYARVDTVKPANLDKMRKSGITWLALGIESADPAVRDGVTKKIRAQDITSVVRAIQDAGISVMGNFIFGLPDDTRDSMRQTLDMAMELNCEFVNFYCAMAYPGSRLYDIAIEEGWDLPRGWGAYSQHSYETLPLPTKHLTAREVLGFRDRAFHAYFANQDYLGMIERKFGPTAREHIEAMTSVRLERELLE